MKVPWSPFQANRYSPRRHWAYNTHEVPPPKLALWGIVLAGTLAHGLGLCDVLDCRVPRRPLFMRYGRLVLHLSPKKSKARKLGEALGDGNSFPD